jgi:GDPmannose 4,6-dehydratase
MTSSLCLSRRTALITGIGGQDGGYLAAHLVAEGYRVVGTSRDARTGRFEGLARLGLLDQVELVSMSPTDFRSTVTVLDRVAPDEIYSLAGQSSVGASFTEPVGTFASIVDGTINLLEAIRLLGSSARFFAAGSSEMFGDTGDVPADESTPVRPRNPYAVAKAASFWQVAQYRDVFGVHACTGILFNHESPLRSERFVTQKVVAAACRIAAGRERTVRLGELSVRRDWGWAPEYVMAMHRMLQAAAPADYVLATGHTSSLEEFVAAVFAAAGLDWRRHVEHDAALMRPAEHGCSRADPSRAAAELDWRARFTMHDVARMMVEARLGAAAVQGAGDGNRQAA